jgi:hypothetical protein
MRKSCRGQLGGQRVDAHDKVVRIEVVDLLPQIVEPLLPGRIHIIHRGTIDRSPCQSECLVDFPKECGRYLALPLRAPSP